MMERSIGPPTGMEQAMARGQRAGGNPVERGSLGTSMMSDLADLTAPPPAVDEGAEAGSDLQTELKKVDRAALAQSRPAEQRRPASGPAQLAEDARASLNALMAATAALFLAAIYKAIRLRQRRRSR